MEITEIPQYEDCKNFVQRVVRDYREIKHLSDKTFPGAEPIHEVSLINNRLLPDGYSHMGPFKVNKTVEEIQKNLENLRKKTSRGLSWTQLDFEKDKLLLGYIGSVIFYLADKSKIGGLIQDTDVSLAAFYGLKGTKKEIFG